MWCARRGENGGIWGRNVNSFPCGMKILEHRPCLLWQDALSIKVTIMVLVAGFIGLWVIPTNMNIRSEGDHQKNIGQGICWQTVFPVMDSTVLLAPFKQLQRKVCCRGLSSLVVSKPINQRNMMELQTGQITWNTLKFILHGLDGQSWIKLHSYLWAWQALLDRLGLIVVVTCLYWVIIKRWFVTWDRGLSQRDNTSLIRPDSEVELRGKIILFWNMASSWWGWHRWLDALWSSERSMIIEVSVINVVEVSKVRIIHARY